MRSNYQVGQILYLFSDKTMKVFPVQIVEEVVRNSLKGRQVAYTIMMPDKKKTVTELDKVNARIFNKLSELELFMEQNSKRSIAQILKSALTLSSIFTEPEAQLEDEVEDTQSSVEEPSNDLLSEDNNVQTNKKYDTIKVDIGNGIKANIKVEDLAGISIINE